MGRVFLRPGPWKLTYGGSQKKSLFIDDEIFEIPPGNATQQTIEFTCRKHCTFEDTDIQFFRNPVTAVVSVDSVGQTEPSAFGTKLSATKSKKLKVR